MENWSFGDMASYRDILSRLHLARRFLNQNCTFLDSSRGNFCRYGMRFSSSVYLAIRLCDGCVLCSNHCSSRGTSLTGSMNVRFRFRRSSANADRFSPATAAADDTCQTRKQYSFALDAKNFLTYFNNRVTQLIWRMTVKVCLIIIIWCHILCMPFWNYYNVNSRSKYPILLKYYF